MAFIDEVGHRYGRLRVLEYAGTLKGVAYFTVQCNCSTTSVDHPISGRDLRSGNSQSCGCLQRDRARAYRKNIGRQKRLVRISRAPYAIRSSRIWWKRTHRERPTTKE